MILKLCQLKAGMKQGTFSWKIYEENMHQKLVPDPFLILLNNPEQPLHPRNYFKNKIF